MTPFQPLWTPDDKPRISLAVIPGDAPKPVLPPARVVWESGASPWTESDDLAIITAYREFCSISVIASRVARSVGSVSQRLRRLRAEGRLGRRVWGVDGPERPRALAAEILPRVLIKIEVARDVIDLRNPSAISWPPAAPDAEPVVKLIPLLQAVAAVCGVTVMELTSARRQRHLVEARHIYFWMARHYTARSYPEIGLRCNKDHSTVIHGVKVIDDLKAFRPRHFRAVQAKVTAILLRLGASSNG